MVFFSLSLSGSRCHLALTRMTQPTPLTILAGDRSRQRLQKLGGARHLGAPIGLTPRADHAHARAVLLAECLVAELLQ